VAVRGNAFVYLVGFILALVLLQAAVWLLFSLVPTLLFLVAAIIAAVCVYAIYTEKDGRRIAGIDRLLGIVTVAQGRPVSAAASAARAMSSADVDDAEDRPERRDTVPPDVPVDVTHVDESLVPPIAQAPSGSPKIDYAGIIDDIRSRPIPKPSASARNGRDASPDSVSSTKIDYDNLIAKINLAAPSVMSKDELIASIAKSVIGQRAAIETLATYVRGKIGARDTGKNKPLVFLLPGPTGTGKTEVSKALAEALGTKLVRFDMGEYGDEFKASNLFGSPKGYIGSEDGGALPNAIRKGGRRLVILFDEVEKAHQSIWQKMLAFFDEGRTGDSKGEVTAPKDTILLMTTNRRAEEVANDPTAAREILRHDGYFSAEFMGRVEKVVPMPRLTDTDMMELTHRLSGVLARTYGVSLDVDEDALVALYAESRDGAQRSGGRGITERLKDLLIDDLLELQGDGRAVARIVVSEGRVRAVPA
jgi:hypothetical protein